MIPLVPLFGSTMFISAFLMFVVELMVAKMVLPILGGAPMVWNTCVVFFQVTLVAGYAYAHGATGWLGRKRQAAFYGVLLLLPLFALPFVIHSRNPPPVSGDVAGWLLVVLAISIGLPFFVLSTSTSMLQELFSGTDHPDARDPYFLYTASNLGSLIGLLSYPLVIEPTLTLRNQSRLWTFGYAAFVALALLCVVVARRRVGEAQVPDVSSNAAPVTWCRRARWMALAFVPSSLMLAVTSYLSTDIAAVPLMWMVPLALYLLTFVLAFGSKGEPLRQRADRRLPLVVLALAVFMIVHAVGPVWLVLPLHLLAFAMSAVLCHAELASDRPSPSHLTEFYFWVSVGGMVGGLFNTLVAPLAFPGGAEYPLVLLAACAFRRREGVDDGRSWWTLMDVTVAIAIALIAVASLATLTRIGGPRLALALPAFACLSQKARPGRFTLSLAGLFLVGTLAPNTTTDGLVIHRERTFFGMYRVNVDPDGLYHRLFHGTTLHGMQALDPLRQQEPLAYYHRSGPFGEAMTAMPHVADASDVAVVGLGVGALASYAGPSQRWTFYEIDPAVERIARSAEYFTYLRTCGDRCRVVLGDARRSLGDASPGRYGLIVLDAFSSDAIPMHLMTREAVALYVSRLAEHGVLLFHISNRHLALGPVLARLASSEGLVVREREDNTSDVLSANGKTPSHWIAMATHDVDLGGLAVDPRWSAPRLPRDTPLWTDDFSNILSVLMLNLQ